jgi:hypothetical protein
VAPILIRGQKKSATEHFGPSKRANVREGGGAFCAGFKKVAKNQNQLTIW